MPGIFRPIHTKVVGVSRTNDDGTSRQDILAGCEEGDQLILERDEYNEHDENAIKVLTYDGEQIGYIKRELAAEIAPLMGAGIEFNCEIEEITGGVEGKETLGCNIVITGRSVAKASETAKKGNSWKDIQISIPVYSCKNCGNKMDKTAKFCTNCGVELIFPSATNQAATKTNKPKRGFWGCLGSIIKFLLILFLLLTIVRACANLIS